MNQNQKPIRALRRFQLTFFSKGMLYAGSSFIHLVSFVLYFLFLSDLNLYSYHNPTLWHDFIGFYCIVAGILFWHGLRTLYRGYHSLPDFETPDDENYQTERLTQE